MKYLIIILVSVINLISADLQKVSLQLQWFDQFQFAGYYIAKEKGFYRDVGLDVDILRHNSNINPVEKVLTHQANYGTGRTSLIIESSKGKDIVALSAIFQSSPLVLLAKKSSNIKTVEDFRGKRLSITGYESTMTAIHALLKSKKINFDDVILQRSENKLKDLIEGKTDIISAYSSNQIYLLKKKGIEYHIFDPKDYQFNFYSDILFTTRCELETNKQRTINFRNASLRGWKYAFSHIEESVNLILTKYNSQNKSKEALIYEANELKKLAYYQTIELGKIDKNRIQGIYDIYNIMGLVDKKCDLDKFVYTPSSKIIFTKEEEKYLKNKKILRMCIDPDWMPFEKIKNGEHIGLASDYIKIIEEKINIPIKLVETKNWDISIKKAKKRECDIFSMVPILEKRKQYMYFTSPYLEIPMVIATKSDEPFIEDIKQILDKKIGVVQSYSIADKLKEKYPNINLVEVKSINDGLKQVEKGKVFAFIDNLATINYEIQRNFIGIVKISGRLERKLKYRIATRNDEPLLHNICQKIIENITLDKKREIYNRWVRLEKREKFDYSMIFEILGVLFIILLSHQYFLRKSNRRLKQLISSAIEGVVIFENGKIIEANQAILDMLGYSLLEMRGKTAYDFIKKEQHTFLKEHIKENRKPYEFMMKKKDSTYFPALARGTNISKTKRVSSILDLTKLKDVQNRLELLNQSLQEKIDSEVLKNREKDHQLLEQSRFAQMGEMISMIAHQWRQPLGAISSAVMGVDIKLETGKFDLSIESQRYKFLEIMNKKHNNINDYVQFLSSTIDDFRNFFKPDKEKQLISLNIIFEKVFNIVKSSIINKGIEIIFNSKVDNKILCYQNELMQVVLNILKNSEDNFMERDITDAKIKIDIMEESGNFVISICDNGGGVPEEIIDKIFDPYFSTKSDRNGTGLGLYMSKTIIEEHCGGKLTVLNNKEGVCFKIILR